MPDFGIFRGFNDKLFGDKLVAGQLPINLGLIGSGDFDLRLLDKYPNAAAAYSLRLLRATYTGKAIKVRRTNNDVADIGFTLTGELDTATLLAFTGTGALDNGFVTTWYDQSGNGYDATQTTAANQPQIVSSGSVITENGKAALRFDGINDNLQYAGEVLNQGTFIGFAVVRVAFFTGTLPSTSAFGRIFDQSSINGGALIANSNTGNAEIFARTSAGNVILTDTTFYANQTLYTGQILSGNSKLRINSADRVLNSTTFTMSGNTGLNFVIGDNSPPSGQSLNGDLQEIVIYTTNQNSNINGIETNINSHYNIY
jgi:hypothetical protein